MTSFIYDDIWRKIKQLSTNSKRTKIAVAYLGSGASKLISFKKGDTLILAMSLNNVKMGLINPFEVEEICNRGVQIFNVSNLHAKIYLFDKKILVGSPNISLNSSDNLIESAILTNDKNTITDAEAFFRKHSIEKVETDYIELCKKHYNPPEFNGKKTMKYGKGPRLSRLWVINTKSIALSDEELKILEEDKDVYERKIADKKTFQLDEIKYPIKAKFINEVQEGDIIIEILNHKVRTQIFHPKRALGVSINPASSTAFLRVEERINQKTKSWTDFDKMLRKHGIKSIKKHSTRHIQNFETKKVLLDYFNG